MTCPGCGHGNPAAAHFCGGCGARLEMVCAACETPNPPGNRFCHRGSALPADPAADRFASPQTYTPRHLAEKILTTAGALKGERKQVTVLSVDVSGFTSLSERLDPEEVHRLMSRAFDLMLAEVHRYEGTVNQFLGDGIMALFGAPIAHEDHARRAVHAALGIGRTLVRRWPAWSLPEADPMRPMSATEPRPPSSRKCSRPRGSRGFAPASKGCRRSARFSCGPCRAEDRAVRL